MKQLIKTTLVSLFLLQSAWAGGLSGGGGTVNQGTSPWVTSSSQLPATLGQKTMADSLACTMASDQASFPVTVSGVATASNQTTGNTSLDTIVTNTTGLATAAAQTTGNSSLSTIASNTSGVATAANQTTGNANTSAINGKLPTLMAAAPSSDTGQSAVPVRVISQLGAGGGGGSSSAGSGPVETDLVFANLVNASAVGNLITKTGGGDAWNAGGTSSVQYAKADDITFSWEAGTLDQFKFGGFSTTNPAGDYIPYEFGILLGPLSGGGTTRYRVTESDTNPVADFTGYVPGTIFSIRISPEGTVTYMKDGVVFYTSLLNASAARYYAAISLFTTGSTVDGATITKSTPGNALAIRLTDGSAFYKATTPADTQPVSLFSGQAVNTFTTTGNGTVVGDGSSKAFKSYSIQVVQTGTVTSWDVRLECSLNGTDFSTVITHTNADGGAVKSSTLDQPCLYFRSRTAGIVLGVGTNVVVSVLGVQ